MRRSAPLLATAGPPEENRHGAHRFGATRNCPCRRTGPGSGPWAGLACECSKTAEVNSGVASVGGAARVVLGLPAAGSAPSHRVEQGEPERLGSEA